MSLADRVISLGGRDFTLRYSVRAMAALQDHWGLKSFQEVSNRMEVLDEQLSAHDLVGILWAGLRTHHREMTKDDVMDILDEAESLQAIQQSITLALIGALPDEEKGPPGPAPLGPTSPGQPTE